MHVDVKKESYKRAGVRVMTRLQQRPSCLSDFNWWNTFEELFHLTEIQHLNLGISNDLFYISLIPNHMAHCYKASYGCCQNVQPLVQGMRNHKYEMDAFCAIFSWVHSIDRESYCRPNMLLTFPWVFNLRLLCPDKVVVIMSGLTEYVSDQANIRSIIVAPNFRPKVNSISERQNFAVQSGNTRIAPHPWQCLLCCINAHVSR